MARRLWIATQDYWVSIGIFVGIAISVYDLLAKFTSWGLVTANWVLPTGVFLFFISGVFAIIKYWKKERDLETKKAKAGKINAESKYQRGGQTIAANSVNIYGQNSKKVDMAYLSDYDEISRLMSAVITNTTKLAGDIRLRGNRRPEEIYQMALQSEEDFSNYIEDHRHYYSANARESLDKLDKLALMSIQFIWIALTSGDSDSFIKEGNKFRLESKALREEIINEFQKGPIQ